MGCCYSKDTDDGDTVSWISQLSQLSFGSKNWFFKPKDQDLRFYILADSVRAKHMSLGHNMVHSYNDEDFQVDVKLMTNGDLRVDLIRKGDDHDAQ